MRAPRMAALLTAALAPTMVATASIGQLQPMATPANAPAPSAQPGSVSAGLHGQLDALRAQAQALAAAARPQPAAG
ncbi:hypothetical protein [Kitasatospora aureofaciens]|uniref:hypothetical protein n=1 Tax=Kitasatospora aureofaciens TaxID=1894 RepID=UPI0036F47C91